MNLAQLKIKYADLFERMVFDWVAKARRFTGGTPDRSWAYTCAEKEFASEMRRWGELQ